MVTIYNNNTHIFNSRMSYQFTSYADINTFLKHKKINTFYNGNKFNEFELKLFNDEIEFNDINDMPIDNEEQMKSILNYLQIQNQLGKKNDSLLNKCIFECCKKFPTNASILIKLALYIQQKENYQDAIRIYEYILSLGEKSVYGNIAICIGMLKKQNDLTELKYDEYELLLEEFNNEKYHNADILGIHLYLKKCLIVH